MRSLVRVRAVGRRGGATGRMGGGGEGAAAVAAAAPARASRVRRAHGPATGGVASRPPRHRCQAVAHATDLAGVRKGGGGEERTRAHPRGPPRASPRSEQHPILKSAVEICLHECRKRTRTGLCLDIASPSCGRICSVHLLLSLSPGGGQPPEVGSIISLPCFSWITSAEMQVVAHPSVRPYYGAFV